MLSLFRVLGVGDEAHAVPAHAGLHAPDSWLRDLDPGLVNQMRLVQQAAVWGAPESAAGGGTGAGSELGGLSDDVSLFLALLAQEAVAAALQGGASRV